MGQTAEDLRRQLDDQRETVGRDLVAIGDRVSPGRVIERRRTALRHSVRRARNAVMGAADSASSSTSDVVGGAGASVSSAAASVTEAAADMPAAVRSQTQGNPLAAGLVALGAGALVGSLLPTTRPEEEAAQQVQPALESAAGAVGEQALDLSDSIKEHAGEAVDRLKATAQGAAESVKDDVAEAAQGVQAAASSTPGGGDAPSPEDPTRFPAPPAAAVAPLDEAPLGRTPSDPNETPASSRPPTTS